LPSLLGLTLPLIDMQPGLHMALHFCMLIRARHLDWYKRGLVIINGSYL